jgi:hypothetical protein
MWFLNLNEENPTTLKINYLAGQFRAGFWNGSHRQ